MLSVPPFVIGFPVYDVGLATSYIQRQIERLGYTTRRAMPTVIHVTWSKPVSKNIPVVIDHSHDADVPSLINLAKTAQKIRAKKK
jgi:endo-1,4-beta-mannosidase